MKLLYLVRHAKAISPESGINDFKRSLSKQGLEDAKAMGKRLKKKGIAPDILLSSPADRALETAHIFAQELGYPVQNILLKDEFYDEGEGIILEMLKGLPDSSESLMLFGHEPTLSQVAALFLNDTEMELRTSGVLGIALEIGGWQELAEAAGTLVFFDFPVRATPKVYKKARKAIAGEITATMENILENFDSDASRHLEKILEKTSRKLAKQLTKVLQASKVEEIAKVHARQRIDTRKEFERSAAAEPIHEEGQPSREAGEHTSEPEAPQTAQQQETEGNDPAPKPPQRRRSTRRRVSKTEKSPATRSRQRKETTTDSGEPTSEAQN